MSRRILLVTAAAASSIALGVSTQAKAEVSCPVGDLPPVAWADPAGDVDSNNFPDVSGVGLSISACKALFGISFATNPEPGSKIRIFLDTNGNITDGDSFRGSPRVRIAGHETVIEADYGDWGESRAVIYRWNGMLMQSVGYADLELGEQGSVFITAAIEDLRLTPGVVVHKWVFVSEPWMEEGDLAPNEGSYSFVTPQPRVKPSVPTTPPTTPPVTTPVSSTKCMAGKIARTFSGRAIGSLKFCATGTAKRASLTLKAAFRAPVGTRYRVCWRIGNDRSDFCVYRYTKKFTTAISQNRKVTVRPGESVYYAIYLDVYLSKNTTASFNGLSRIIRLP